MLGFGLFVLGRALCCLWSEAMPDPATMEPCAPLTLIRPLTHRGKSHVLFLAAAKPIPVAFRVILARMNADTKFRTEKGSPKLGNHRPEHTKPG